MLSITRLSMMAAVLISGAVFTTDADAGSCRRSYRRTYVVPTRPVSPPLTRAPGGPGALPPGGGPGAAGPGAGGPGQGAAGQGQGAAAQGQQAGKAGQTTTVNVPVGATVTLPGNRGEQMGQVNLVLNNVRLPLNVLDWNESGITVTLPEMQITSATQAQIEIKRPGSSTAENLSIQLEPRPTVLVLETPSVIVAPPAPNQAEGAPAQPEGQLADN